MLRNRRKLDYLSRLRLFTLSVFTVFGVVYFSPRVEAAESVVLKYNVLREKISVAELKTFAETGQLSPKLRFYLKLARREPNQLRRVLNQSVPVNGTVLYRVLTNPIGEVMLDQASQVVHTPDNRANRQSLRSALVSSALPDSQITLMETLENYPTPEVHVEGERLAEVAQQLMQLMRRLPTIRP